MFVCYECNKVISGKIFMANDYSFCSCKHRNNYLKIINSFNNKKMEKTISFTNINSISNTSIESIPDINEYEKKKPERSRFDIYKVYNLLNIKKTIISSNEAVKMFLDMF